MHVGRGDELMGRRSRGGGGGSVPPTLRSPEPLGCGPSLGARAAAGTGSGWGALSGH